jgi:lanosterol synthase
MNKIAFREEIDNVEVLQKGVKALLAQQNKDGSWEGEVVWCPMLPAQYVLMCYITQTPIKPRRKQAILQQFQATQFDSGLWGLHEQSEPYLFITTLVYVAARILGVKPDDPLIVNARDFIQHQGGVIPIPSWGKFWLAMLNLYDWRGVNPILPEIWLLPQWVFAHPANYYCHTRLIYLGMAYIYASKFQVPLTALIQELREELYLKDYQQIDFNRARSSLRMAEIYSPPSWALRLFYNLAAIGDRFHLKPLRQKIMAQMLDQVRFELQTTDYTCISPVSGLLNIISLWLNNPQDADFSQACDRFEGWFWEDETAGLRIAGARSSTWDTSFAIQALQAASPYIEEVVPELELAENFLATQQIKSSFPNYEKYFRIDPQGGFCFAGVWHGWTVSDCTAEALVALLNASESTLSSSEITNGIEFILRCQNADGGFGSYERRKTASTLEWLNPAEMFANSMTEHSYTECTASCLSALSEFQHHYPNTLTPEIDTALKKGATLLRKQQKADGSWLGVWGVNIIYGTMFGIQGLLATGALHDDSAIVKATDWLLSKQRADGGWGEHFQGCLSREYIEHTQSQVIQTAWALKALLEARVNNWSAIDRGIAFLGKMQLEDGDWAKQDPGGVFFNTALLDYVLYRRYFPIWVLSLYQSRKQEAKLVSF